MASQILPVYCPNHQFRRGSKAHGGLCQECRAKAAAELKAGR